MDIVQEENFVKMKAANRETNSMNGREHENKVKTRELQGDRGTTESRKKGERREGEHIRRGEGGRERGGDG